MSKNYTNVLKAKIISSIFPIVNKTINFSNNKLYWRNISDGNYIYELEIMPGNYSVSQLISEITQQFAKTPRMIIMKKDCINGMIFLSI